MEYSINPKKGIYYTTKAYHDDLDYHYVVDFDKPDVHAQFLRFLQSVEGEGAKKGMRRLKEQFRGLRELLS
jgi:hypothetical protein